MKDIKELIYAAVEENAVAFQELAGGILQARAYDAIESLRPEIGASMFGESSHMKGKDDEDEEMEDEEEMDDKKKSMKEALHVLVHKAFQDNVEKAHHAVSGAGNPNFRPSKGMARIDKPGGQHDPTGGDHHVIHAPAGVTHAALKKNLSDYGARATIVDTHTGNHETVHEGFDQIDEEAKATVDALKKVHGDHNFHVDKKGEISHAYLKPSHVKKLVTALKTPGKGKGMIDGMMEEVEQIDEASYNKDSEHHKNARKAAKSMGGKATYHPNGHASVRFQDTVHGRSTVNPKGTVLSTGEKDAKHVAKSYGGKAVGNVVHFGEEVEQINEVGDTEKGKAALTNLASHRLGRANWARGVHAALHNNDGAYGPRKIDSPHGRLAAADSKVAVKAAAKVGIKPHEIPSHNYDYDKKGGYGTKVADPAHKLAARNKPKMEEVGLDEVAMPKNAADWQALITHQIKTTGHPVATDAQFRATHGKDTSKIASLEPGEDKMHYAAAQGGTVKA